MADQASLRLIGLSFGAITTLVILIASLVVADATRRGLDQTPPRMASSGTVNG